MKLLINTSNLIGGGGVQVAISFINECTNFSNHEYFVLLCTPIYKQLDINKFPSNFHFYNISLALFPLSKIFSEIRKLSELEKIIQPDCVFSIFGPTYWTPKSVHLMGFAIAHFLYPDSPFFSRIRKGERFKWKLLSLFKHFYIKHNANFYVVETEDVRLKLSKYLSCSINSIFVVSNTYNSVFDSVIVKPKLILPQRNGSEFRLVCISTYYSHKNLEILNHVIPLLNKQGIVNVRFVLTINNKIFRSIFSKEAQCQIFNVGPILIENCPQLYSECDAVFLPTLLECFSANYPEAMKMQKPILTSNLSFAKDICGNAALFFDPFDEHEIVESIIRLINNKSLQLELIEKGSRQLDKFNNAKERASKYLCICEQIADNFNR